MKGHDSRTPEPPLTTGRGSTAYPPVNGKLRYGPGEEYRDAFRDVHRRSERGAAWRSRKDEAVSPLARKRVLFPLAFLLSFIAALAYIWVQSPGGQEVWKATQRLVQPQKSLSEIFEAPGITILLIGLDHVPTRKGERVLRHSDSIMVASTDFETRQVRMVSLPRDGWAMKYYAGHGVDNDKLAHTYGYGQEQQWDDPQSGVRCTKETVERLLDLERPLDYYVVIDFEGFKRVIDALGGVEIEVEKRMRYRDRRGNLNIDLKPGLQKLNGEQAMGYARFRHDALSDIARMGRQQKVLRAVLEELKRPENLPRLPQLFTIFRENVQTNLSLDQLLALAQNIDEYDTAGVKSMTIENYGPLDGPAYGLGSGPASQWAQYIPPEATKVARLFLADLEPPPPPAEEVAVPAAGSAGADAAARPAGS